MADELLIFHVWPARRKAKLVAIQEAVTLLEDLEARVAPGGPLADQPGIFWIWLPEEGLVRALSRLSSLGYTSRVDIVRLGASTRHKKRTRGRYKGHGSREPNRWKGRPYTLDCLFEADIDRLRAEAPDRRSFVLPTVEGGLRAVRGYRGDGSRMGRRALPAIDARVLVNLAAVHAGSLLLDPFAGAGGIVCAAARRGCIVHSSDIDPILVHGLRSQGSRHVIADARQLPYAPGVFDAVATEPPFDDESTCAVVHALEELQRVLAVAGRLVMMVASTQQDVVAATAAKLGFTCELQASVDRKGTPVSVLAFTRDS